MTRPSRREEGFALPFTIFLIAFLTVLLAAAALRVAADRRVAEAMGRSSNAFAVAQSGLQYYMGTRTKRPEFDTANWTPQHDGDSMRVNVNGGYALVVARIVQRPADTSANETYLVRSTGYHVIPVLGAEPQAARTLAQFAIWQSATIDVHGALAAINGMAGPLSANVRINGTDSCTPKKTAGLRGLAAVAGGTVDSQYNTNSSATLATETDINWSKTVASPPTPDFIGAAQFTSTNTNTNNYSVFFINGNATIFDGTTGTGLLIVTGRLTFATAFQPGAHGWKGLILVGNDIKFNTGVSGMASNYYIVGQAISGLNNLTNNSSGTANDLTQNYTSLRIKYSSCEVASALAKIAGMRPVANAWIDNWASY